MPLPTNADSTIGAAADAASSWHTALGQTGMIVAGLVLILFIIWVVMKLIRIGSIAAAIAAVVIGLGGGIPSWAAMRSWLQTKGWA